MSLVAKEGKKVVVIGSSFIGLEIVVTVLPRKLASIDVVGRGEAPFEPVLGKDVGGAIQKVKLPPHRSATRSYLARSSMNLKG